MKYQVFLNQLSAHRIFLLQYYKQQTAITIFLVFHEPLSSGRYRVFNEMHNRL